MQKLMASRGRRGSKVKYFLTIIIVVETIIILKLSSNSSGYHGNKGQEDRLVQTGHGHLQNPFNGCVSVNSSGITVFENLVNLTVGKHMELVAENAMALSRNGDMKIGEVKNTELGERLQCSDLIRGHIESTNVAEEWLKSLKKDITPDKSFITLTKNCEKFTSTRGYFDKPVTNEEINFPLAFSILMYKSVHQVEQLLRTIYRPHNIYCIHVDKKAPSELHIAMKAITSCFDNVFIASRLTNVVWASISIVNAERYCQKDLLAKNKKWKYLINLTGQEFPLKTNLEIVQILKEFKGQNDIHTSSKSYPRTKYKYFVENGKVVTLKMIKTEPVPKNVTIRKGGLHCALTRPFVEFLHQNGTATEFLEWLNDTLIPDESFYPSLASLPEAPGGPGLKTSQSTVTKAVMWVYDKNNSICQGKVVRNVCIFSWEDLPWIVRQPHMFINKFHVDYDPLVLHCLEEFISKRTKTPIKLNLNFYRKFIELRSLPKFDTEEDNPWVANEKRTIN
ncbi:beta-1,3-galactosyl-O-glycosyl-glycoprotein beta-1,6-N-acetylglucosaminyltransferase-like [Glandiceps talaboti]